MDMGVAFIELLGGLMIFYMQDMGQVVVYWRVLFFAWAADVL
jgi:hypothetical protein